MNGLLIQCGGPTAVINASLAAAIGGWQNQPTGQKLWGARLGLQGLVQGDWVDLTATPQTVLRQLHLQPGAALGGGRHRLQDDDVVRVLERLHAHHIDALFIMGGNGSMAVAHKMWRAAHTSGYEVNGQPLQVIGIPKTVDNDLAGTDCAPGYGSAARFIAQTTHDVALDLYSMRAFDDVAIIEIMGRHAGWLTAASGLARTQPSDGPHLILLPEVAHSQEKLLAEIARVHAQHGICLVAVSEGIRDPEGDFWAEKLGTAQVDQSGQRIFGTALGVGPSLTTLVRQHLQIQCRYMRPDLIQRSSSGLASETDRELARQVGQAAVDALANGETDVMIGLRRQGTEWQCHPVPLLEIIEQERKLPAHFMAADGFDITREFVAYAAPLMGGWRPSSHLF